MNQDYIDKLRQQREAASQKEADNTKSQALIDAVKNSGDATKDEVTSAIHDLMLATLVSKDPRLVDVSQNLVKLFESISGAAGDLKNSGLALLPDIHQSLVDALKALPDAVAQTDKSPELIPYLQQLIQATRAKSTAPVVNVSAPSFDTKSLERLLSRIEQTVSSDNGQEFDTQPIEDALGKVEKAVRDLIAKPIPVANLSLPTVTSTTDSTKKGIIALNPDGSNISGGAGSGGTASTTYTGQATVNTTAVQISSTTHVLINGMIIKAPSSNSAVIYVGLTGVTTSTGDILEPGESRGYGVNNTNLLYIISAASTTDKISYSAS